MMHEVKVLAYIIITSVPMHFSEDLGHLESVFLKHVKFWNPLFS